MLCRLRITELELKNPQKFYNLKKKKFKKLFILSSLLLNHGDNKMGNLPWIVDYLASVCCSLNPNTQLSK